MIILIWSLGRVVAARLSSTNDLMKTLPSTFRLQGNFCWRNQLRTPSSQAALLLNSPFIMRKKALRLLGLHAQLRKKNAWPMRISSPRALFPQWRLCLWFPIRSPQGRSMRMQKCQLFSQHWSCLKVKCLSRLRGNLKFGRSPQPNFTCTFRSPLRELMEQKAILLFRPLTIPDAYREYHSFRSS